MIKKSITAIFLAAVLLGCKNKEEQVVESTSGFVAYSHEKAENAVIYEANIRQYSPEGTFEAFTKDIPVLKELGVKIIWLMPVHPIGEKNRKEGLGSYYSIKDYRGINPEFGTADDFKKLIETAHENGIYVILDWVANHTAWDHAWVEQNPEYYFKNDKGEMVAPYDWTDVVKLDYNNPELRKAMVGEMRYWIENFNIDGFRCDVAYEVPTDFWEDATAELNKIKTLFMLAEAEKPELHKKAFDMVYGWESHHLMNAIAKGEKTVEDWDNYIAKRDTIFEKDDFTMYFTSNHDENTWAGTEYDRMGEAVEVMTALTYLTPGMPLIYNGQEYDSKVRLKFFEKDQISKEKGKMFEVYKKLGHLKNTSKALAGAKNPANYNRIKTSADDNILAFERSNNNEGVIFIANLSKNTVEFNASISGNYKNYMTGKFIKLNKDENLILKPFEYFILIK